MTTYRPTADQMADVLERLLASPTSHGIRSEAREMVLAYTGKTDEGAAAFKMKAERVGADPAWYYVHINTDVTINGKTVDVQYRVVDIQTHRPKNCIVLMSRRGKRKFASVDWVAEHLGRPDGRVRTRALGI